MIEQAAPLPRSQLFVQFDVGPNAMRCIWQFRRTDWPEGQMMLYFMGITPYN